VASIVTAGVVLSGVGAGIWSNNAASQASASYHQKRQVLSAQLATARHLPLVLVGDGRRARAAAAELSHKGIPASSGPPPQGSLLVAIQDDASAAGAHLSVRAGSGEDIGDRPEIGTPVSALAQEGQQ